MQSPFAVDVTPDWEALLRCIKREGTPERVHHIELFLDPEVMLAVAERFDLEEGLDRSDPMFWHRLNIKVQEFLGYDYVRCGVDNVNVEFNYETTTDTAEMARSSGRSYINLKRGPITTWEEFEQYPWPDPAKLETRALEFYNENLPDNMCIIGGAGAGHYMEFLSWLMGYEVLCVALYDDRDLVKAISQKLFELFEATAKLILQFDRVKALWGSDDMGFRSATLISPDDLREFVLPGHKRSAELAHEAGRPYLLHTCGNVTAIYDDLIDYVKIDAKHSFEDTIEDVRDLKDTIGQRIALLGGIDVDFLCRASEEEIRTRVRDTLDKCQPGGGYCLGTGNSVANYIPLENYLAMLDEGRKWGS
jgi:uroporphyrinogen decarboxylase